MTNPYRSFSKLLVANRGEIACRVLSTARKLGYRTVAVCTPPDRGARCTKLSDEVVELQSVSDYLSAEAILDAAQASGAEAIHPGYGFLSENSAFAKAVKDAGLVFVGPSAEAIELMGSKRLSKLEMQKADVPTIPGFTGDAGVSLDVLEAEALKLGFPLMIKASAGGGGRGLRRVDSKEGLRSQLELAQSEATSSFGSGELILERALDGAKHIEVQVLGDHHGTVVHLFERDCSMQRRHQKVIEEAPSPSIDPELRAAIGQAAVRAAQAVNYVGAGTVEMLVQDRDFYFMEMNTRLQVEHPVTEMVTGTDLVALQLDVARGKPLPFAQDDLRMNGHAIEVRLYAEDPGQGFLPCVGTVEGLQVPTGLRVDHGLEYGTQITTDYDPMLAKLIAHGIDREEAIRKLSLGLEQLTVFGLTTNQAFLYEAVNLPEFVRGDVTTKTLEGAFEDYQNPSPEPLDWAAAGIAGRDLRRGWSSTGCHRYRIALRHEETQTQLSLQKRDLIEVRLGQEEFQLEVVSDDGQTLELGYWPSGDRASLKLRTRYQYLRSKNTIYLSKGCKSFAFEAFESANNASSSEGGNLIRAPMAGKVIAVHVKNGEQVEPGAALVTLEAMKMQLEIKATHAGPCILKVHEGAQLRTRQVVAEVQTEDKHVR